MIFKAVIASRCAFESKESSFKTSSTLIMIDLFSGKPIGTRWS